MSGAVVRKNVVLTKASEARLKRIKFKADLDSDAEAIRATLRLYEKLMAAQLDRKRVEIVDPTDGSRTVLDELFERFVSPDSDLDTTAPHARPAIVAPPAAATP